jgi:DNA polymerase-1
MTRKNCLIIIDSNSIIHRAYHALPPLTTKRGELVNAIFGFLLVFLKVIREFQPDFIVAAFDFPAPTFRHKKYKEYKAKRPPAPEKLYQQIPIVKEVLGAFDVPIFEKEGFEADDIIGTIAHLVPKKQVLPKVETIILSGDLDTLQLINPQTKVYSLRKGVKDTVLYDEKLVREKFQGLNPEQLLDFKALRGDPSDNIPGVTGVGEKTAIELLLKFGSLENLYKAVEEDKSSSPPFTAARIIEENSEKTERIKPKLKETLLKYKEQAYISKDLAELCKNVSIDFNLEKSRWRKYSKEKVTQIFKKYEFQSLIERLQPTRHPPKGPLPELKKSKKNDKIKEVKASQQNTLF